MKKSKQQLDWLKQANCKGLGNLKPNIFFSNTLAHRRRARAVCAICPVIQECFEFSLNAVNKYNFGIWAGLGTRERLVFGTLMKNTNTMPNLIDYSNTCLHCNAIFFSVIKKQLCPECNGGR
jgi:hypothetical protein